MAYFFSLLIFVSFRPHTCVYVGNEFKILLKNKINIYERQRKIKRN